MPGAFDPYHAWLGIAPNEQPPNHYRLLGLPPFEDQPAAIEHAADQRVAHLRKVQTGKHGKAAQKLLNEVAAARVCLLNSQKRAAYDRQLRQTLQAEAAGARKPPLVRRELTGERTVTYRPQSAEGERAGQTTAESTQLGRLGEYELLEKLGRGGMGVVYKARHTKLDREVALKVLPKGQIEDEEAIARFEREMVAVGHLDHSNVVRAYDAREIEGTCFLVMEFVDGLDLAEFVRRYGPLPVAEACEVIRQAALGLQSAHEHGLVHRDVKPSNLMLTHEGKVKVLDLGLARFQLDQPGAKEMTATGRAMGTLDYMAPEQISDTHSVDIRADVYALGCTLYKLLTGQAPFSGPEYESAFDKMRAHLQEPVPPIRRFRRDVPAELAAVINRMLAKEPGLRFGTPVEVADAIGPLAAGSDLPGLLNRAGHKPPVVKGSRSLEVTEGSPSSGLTRFFRRLKSERDRPGVRSAAADENPWAKPTIIIGSAAVGVLLLAIVIAFAVKSGAPPSEDTTEVATVEGSKPVEGPGPSPPAPAAEGNLLLVIRLPGAGPTDVLLDVDGKERDLSELREPKPGCREATLPAGPHKIRLVARGLPPIFKSVEVGEGKQATITADWRYALPSEDVQKDLAEKIDKFYHVAEVETKPEKLEAAREMLKEGKQGTKPPDHRYVHLHRAKELAIDGDDKPLMLEAVEAIGRDFKLDVENLKEKALARFEAARREDESRRPLEAEKRYSDALAPIKRMVAAGDPVRAAEEVAKLRFEETEFKERLNRYRGKVQRLADYAEAVQPIQRMVARWDFGGAKTALEKVSVEQEDLVGRLTARRTMVQRLLTLRQKIIDEIKGADPPKRKSELGISGYPGDVIEADQTALTAKLTTGKEEVHVWGELKPTARKKLLELAVDPEDAVDCLAAGLLALDADEESLRNGWISKALSLRGRIEPYLVPFAEADFTRAAESLKTAAPLAKEAFAEEERLFKEAAGLLAGIEGRYAETRWLQDKDNQKALDTASAEAAAGICRAEADSLYVEAEKYLKDNDLFYVRPLLEKLKAEYGDTRAVKDNAQFAEMDQAIAGLGELFIVRKPEEGGASSKPQGEQEPTLPEKVIQEATDAADHFTSIQEAIGAAEQFASSQKPIGAGPPNSLIEIQDSGVYDETVLVRRENKRLTIRGGQGCWPILASSKSSEQVVLIFAPGTSLERLVVVHRPGKRSPGAIEVAAGGDLRLKWLIVDSTNTPAFSSNAKSGAQFEDCLILTDVLATGPTSFTNCLLLAGVSPFEAAPEFRRCTLVNGDANGVFLDSIIGKIVNRARREYPIRNCDVFGQAAPTFGENCLSVGPQFRDPDNFDFRLSDDSPCRGKASDGGDIGVRYTPEMLQMCEKALELKRQGLIKFEYKP